MTKRAEQNIAVTLRYLQVKILASMLLEAMSLATGGDIPLFYLIGDVTDLKEEGNKLARLLKVKQQATRHHLDPKVVRILQHGDFDPPGRKCPSYLSLFLYQSMGGEIQAGIEKGNRFVTGEVSAVEFLRSQKPSTVKAIVNTIAEICTTRKKALGDI
jgi:hypothetical protein